MGYVHRSLRSWSAIAAAALNAIARNRGDDAGRVYFADAEIAYVADIQVARRVRTNSSWKIERSLRSWPSISRKAQRAITGHGGDGASGIHPPDAIVVLIRNVEVPKQIVRDKGCAVDRGLRRWSPIARIACRTVPGHRGNRLCVNRSNGSD